ncbi:LmeA family phospholipid-binding protein [Antrihabitans cavernicola]|uniref:DUF2993 domain-containing protein n=1 Tax=Antrihabitans cavernicola TaxID=2495913 RepID=A0A5A7S853_9NOCA|nr:DUF2993 domain-containing protein [Spelaeibacter cavernicola]KAA0022320.1 DUF2993 domain-containing protein [Spelaeibacter cavernicola]
MVSTRNAPAAPRPPTSKRNRVVLIAMLVVGALVVALIAGELFARHTVKNCMSDQFKSELGTQVDVGLSAKPMLLQMIDKDVPYVTIDSDDSSFGPAKDMKVHAKVQDVKIDQTAQSSGSIGSSTANIEWSDQGILSTVQSQSFGGLVSGVTSSGTDGTLTFDVGPAGLAKLTVRPQVQGSTVNLETVNAEILGLGLPTDLVDGIVKTVGDSLQTYPLGMTPKELNITDAGLTMSLAGGQYTMPAVPDGVDLKGCGVLG